VTNPVRPPGPQDPTPPPPPGQPGAPGPRRRKPPRRVEVVSVSRIRPRLVSVWVGGEALDGFAINAPTSHIKVYLPAAGQQAPTLPADGPNGPVWPEDAPRPFVRTYTPRRFDEQSQTLEVQFVLHGEGPASDWAERAAPGDQLAVAGPGGRFSLDPSIERWWIAGDESAIPAVETLLEALPPSASAEVHLEVADSDDEIELSSPAKFDVTWHHRRAPGAWGAELEQAAHDAEVADDTQLWLACEATTVRDLRRYFLVDRQHPRDAIVTRGYWRRGFENHPDHDYGDDELEAR
jgi:NADPH-dependent ferric siderophore reductase